jgi:hypothetical protein
MVMVTKQYKIDYETSYTDNFRTDVKKAIQFYLNIDNIPCEEGMVRGFILYPQALNPFLKIMESLGESRNIIILPAYNNDNLDDINRPAYLIVKIFGEIDYPTQIVTTNK